MIEKKKIYSFFIISLFVFQISSNFIIELAVGAPSPGITINVSDYTITCGETVTVTISATNYGDIADEGDITVNFPDRDYADSEEIDVYDYTTSGWRDYEQGDSIWYDYGTGQRASDNYMIVAYSGFWGTGSTQTLVLRVRPKTVGTFSMHIKFVLIDGSNFYADPVPGSEILDQQDEYSYSHHILVKAPNPNIIDVIYSPTYVFGETATISVECMNSNTMAYSGDIVVSFPEITTTATSVVQVDSYTTPSCIQKWKGDTAGGNYGTETVTLQYAMVDAYLLPYWDAYVSHMVVIHFTPTTAGTYHFLVKHVVADYWGDYYADPSPGTGVYDQQKEYSLQYTITFSQAISKPTKPTLYDPGTTINVNYFTLDWSDSSDSDGYIDEYRIQESSTPTFSTLLDDWYTGSSLSQCSITDKTEGTYYYRVCAIDNDGAASDWSDYQDITIDLLQGPDAPVLNNPGDMILTNEFTLTWSIPDDPDGLVVTYEIHYSETADFSTYEALISFTNSKQITLFNGFYFFRVKAIDNLQLESDWSNLEDLVINVDPWGDNDLDGRLNFMDMADLPVESLISSLPLLSMLLPFNFYSTRTSLFSDSDGRIFVKRMLESWGMDLGSYMPVQLTILEIESFLNFISELSGMTPEIMNADTFTFFKNLRGTDNNLRIGLSFSINTNMMEVFSLDLVYGVVKALTDFVKTTAGDETVYTMSKTVFEYLFDEPLVHSFFDIEESSNKIRLVPNEGLAKLDIIMLFLQLAFSLVRFDFFIIGDDGANNIILIKEINISSFILDVISAFSTVSDFLMLGLKIVGIGALIITSGPVAAGIYLGIKGVAFLLKYCFTINPEFENDVSLIILSADLIDPPDIMLNLEVEIPETSDYLGFDKDTMTFCNLTEFGFFIGDVETQLIFVKADYDALDMNLFYNTILSEAPNLNFSIMVTTNYCDDIIFREGWIAPNQLSTMPITTTENSITTMDTVLEFDEYTICKALSQHTIEVYLEDQYGNPITIASLMALFMGNFFSFDAMEGGYYETTIMIPNLEGIYTLEIIVEVENMFIKTFKQNIRIVEADPPNISEFYLSGTTLEIGEYLKITLEVSDNSAILNATLFVSYDSGASYYEYGTMIEENGVFTIRIKSDVVATISLYAIIYDEWENYIQTNTLTSAWEEIPTTSTNLNIIFGLVSLIFVVIAIRFRIKHKKQ